MAYKNPNGPLQASRIVTGAPPDGYWDIGSSPFNQMLGVPPSNPNDPTPGAIKVDSEPVGVGLWRYFVVIDPPTSPLVTDAQNATLQLIASESTARSAVNLWASDGSIGNVDKSNILTWDDNNFYAFKPILPNAETWHNVGAAGEPAFQGNWAVNGGVTVSFYKDATGRVTLRGRAAEAVASSSVIFTLPVGYRPVQTMSLAAKCNNDGTSICWLSITSAGNVTPIGNTAAAKVQTVLDNISFLTI